MRFIDLGKGEKVTMLNIFPEWTGPETLSAGTGYYVPTVTIYACFVYSRHCFCIYTFMKFFNIAILYV
jgi:hypothetical protein